MPVPGPSFDATRLARLRSRLNGYLTDWLFNSRFQATITAASWSGGSATLTAAGHKFTVGQSVTVSGMTPAGYNGAFTCTAVTLNTFSYAVSNPGTATVFGAANVSLPCRVDETLRDEHLPGMGRMIFSKRWRIVQAYGTAVGAGNILTVTGKGVYAVLEVAQSKSIEVSASAFCLQQRLADGTLNLLTNVQATFRNADQISVTISALVEAIAIEEMLRDQEELFRWQISWDPLLGYTDGAEPMIGANDRVTWTLNGQTFKGNLRQPQAKPGPQIHYTAELDQVVAG